MESEEKAAQQKEASTMTSSLAATKRIASIEEPRGSERERQERTRQVRFKLLGQQYELEDDLKRMNRQLAFCDKDVLLDEQESEDYFIQSL